MAHHGPEDMFIAIMTLVGAFVLMLLINWKLALLTFIVVPIMIWLVVYFSDKMTKAFHRLFCDIADFNARVEDNVGGIRVVQAFANEEHERKLFDGEQPALPQNEAASPTKSWRTTSSISYMLMRFVTLFVHGMRRVVRHPRELTYGEFVGFLLLTNIFFRPIEKINAVIESYPKGSPASSVTWS